MAREAFVDASAWIAVVSQRDQYHVAGVEIYSRLVREKRPLVTTNLVVAEAHIAIRRLSGFDAAARFLESIHQTLRLQLVYSDPELELVAERILRQFRDHELSLVDAVSFAVMRQRQITEALTFDRHFTLAGFSKVP
jgi:uncharacterized protein